MPDYRSGAGLALGLTMLGGGIGSALGARRRKKADKRLAEILAPLINQPMAGKAVSQLAQVLSGVGQAMPIPEHMGGNALPFSPTPTLSPGQMQQMRPPSSIGPENEKNAMIRALITSGSPEGKALGLQMAMPAEAKQYAPMQVAPGNAIVDPSTGGVIYQAPPDKQEFKSITLAPGSKAYDFDGRVIASNDGKEDEVGVVAIDPTDGKRHFFSRSYAIEKRLEAPEPSPGVTVNTGDLTRGVQGDLQTEIYKNVASMNRLTNVRNEWNPNWSYAENQFKQFLVGGVKKSAVLDWAAKNFAGEAYDKALVDYAGYRTWDRDMQEAINKHIRAMTGAVMNQTEIPRYLREMATKVDDAVAYRAKIDATLKSLASATELYNQMLTDGKVTTERANELIAGILEEDLRRIVGIEEDEQPDWVEPVE